mgnify:CR=1 FL=1|jgi:hypothetical protein
MTSTYITLTSAQRALAIRLGEEMYANKMKDSNGKPDPTYCGADNEKDCIMGMAGEIAFREWSGVGGVPTVMKTGIDDGYDVIWHGKRIQVKYTQNMCPSYCFAQPGFREGASDYIVQTCQGDNKTIRLVGYLPEQLFVDQLIDAKKEGLRGRLVFTWQLHPMWSMEEKVKKE